MGKKIFISYRHKDVNYADTIHRYLRDYFGEDNTFIDTHGIPPGENFDTYIDSVLNEFTADDVMLVLVGSQWLKLQDEAGNQKLFIDDDIVKREIELGINTCRVIPVLVDISRLDMPRVEDLPEDLAEFAFKNAFEVRRNSLERDLEELISFIGQPTNFTVVNNVPKRTHESRSKASHEGYDDTFILEATDMVGDRVTHVLNNHEETNLTLPPDVYEILVVRKFVYKKVYGGRWGRDIRTENGLDKSNSIKIRVLNGQELIVHLSWEDDQIVIKK
jgi:hypothetical protein